MTNTKKLQGKMREKAYTIKTLGARIGLTTTGLFNKIHNNREFLASEVYNISVALSLTTEEVNEIFFANSVESNSTEQIEGV